jgi:hypothetical protein
MLLFCILIEQIHILAHQAKNEKIPEKSQIFKKNQDYGKKQQADIQKKDFSRKYFLTARIFHLKSSHSIISIENPFSGSESADGAEYLEK